MVAGDTESIKVLVSAAGVLIVMAIMSTSIITMFSGGKGNIIQKWVNENLGNRVQKLCKKNDKDDGWYPDGNVSRSFSVDEFKTSSTEHKAWGKTTTTYFLQGYKDGQLRWEAKIAATSVDLASGLAGLLPGNDAKGPCEGIEIVEHGTATTGSGRKFFSLKEDDISNSKEITGGDGNSNSKDEIQLHMWEQ